MPKKTVDGKEVVVGHEKPETPEETEVDEAGETAGETQEPSGKSDEELAKLKEMNANLEKKLGEQGRELGDLRKTVRESQQQSSQRQSERQEAQMSPQDALNDVYRQVDSGEISWEEGLKKSNTLAAQMAAEQAMSKVQEELGYRDAQAEANKFLAQYPDFEQVQESGELEQIKGKQPGISDDVTAYFAWKAQKSADEGYNRALEEFDKLAKGAEEQAESVLKKPGAAIRQTNEKPLKKSSDIKSSMMDRLKEVRGG